MGRDVNICFFWGQKRRFLSAKRMQGLKRIVVEMKARTVALLEQKKKELEKSDLIGSCTSAIQVQELMIN